MLDEIGADSIHLRVPDGVLDCLVLSPLTKQTVKTRLSDSLRALMAEAIALFERATEAEETESEVEPAPFAPDIARSMPLAI